MCVGLRLGLCMLEQCPLKPKEVIEFLGFGCELWHGCWAINLVPLQEHQVLLTSEPSLYPKIYFHLILYGYICVAIYMPYVCGCRRGQRPKERALDLFNLELKLV